MDIWQHPNMRHNTIERRSGIGYHEFYKSYTKNSRPVIMTDAIGKWPAMEKWTLEYFRSHVGDHPVHGRDGISRTLSECIDAMLESTKEKPGPYIPSLRFHADYPALYDDINPRPEYWKPDWLSTSWVMPGISGHPLHRVAGIEINLSGPDSTFPEGIHYDDLMSQTFVAQVRGTKQLILFSPEQSHLIYPNVRSENVGTYSYSAIPVDREFDISEYPLASNLEPIITELRPGEMLCTPPGWWHCVRANEQSIAVVTSIANNTIWPKVRRAVINASMLNHKPWKAPIAAAIYASYMTAYGIFRGVEDKFRYRNKN